MSLEILKIKNVRLIIYGKTISIIGTNIQNFALSLYVLKLTGSAKLFSLIIALSILPKIILGPISGVFADKINKKKAVVLLDFLSGILLLSFYFISLFLQIKLLYVYLLVSLLSIINAIFLPFMNSLLLSSLNKEYILQLNSISNLISFLGNFIPPLIAGIIYNFFGIKFVLLINSVAFLISAFFELMIVYNNMINKNKINFKLDFQKGLEYIFKNKIILHFIISCFIINLFFTPLFSIGIPYISKILYKFTDYEYGMLSSLFPIGLLSGPLILNIFFKNIDIKKIFNRGLIINGIIIIFLGVICYFNRIINFNKYFLLSSTIILGVIIILITTITNISLSTLIQKEIPKNYLGRITSVNSSIVNAAIPIGQLLFGILYDSLTSYLPILFTAISLIIIALLNMEFRINFQSRYLCFIKLKNKRFL